MALWLQSNCDCEVIEGLISQKRSDCNQREGEEKTRAQRRPAEGNQSRQARKEKKERRKFYPNMQVDVELILQSPNAFIETLPQLLIGIPIPPTFNVLLLLLFSFLQEFNGGRGGGSIKNDCTTALRCCLETWQLMCEIWDGKQVFEKLLWATSCFSNVCVFPDVSILRRETAPPGPIDGNSRKSSLRSSSSFVYFYFLLEPRSPTPWRDFTLWSLYYLSCIHFLLFIYYLFSPDHLIETLNDSSFWIFYKLSKVC